MPLPSPLAALRSGCRAVTLTPPSTSSSTHSYCFYSDDRGQTWAKTDLITPPKGSTGRKTDPAAEEPMVIELKDRRLMMIMRTYLKSIYRSFFKDGGATWSKPESSGIPSPGSVATIKRLPNGDFLLIWNWARLEDLDGPWPRVFLSSAISKDDGKNFTSVRHLDGAADFPGKITMANVTFSGDNAVLTYSKSMTKKNAYNWRLQVIPIQWFYEGDMEQVYGEPGDQTLLCYAESRGGITWEKPSLGLAEWRGSKDNNIVCAPSEGTIDAPTVLHDPHPTADCRYRMYWHSKGIRGATSPDGLHWKVIDGGLVEAGDRNSAWYDAERKKYIIITRIPGRGLRTCGLWESDNGERFEHVGEIAAPDDQDPENTELYGMIPFAYAGLRLGFLEMFRVPTRKLNTQLLYSRDGLEWHRACNRQTFLDYGPPGSWDQAWVTPSQNPPIRVGDKLFIFYQGRQTLHWADPPFGHIGSVGLAFLRPDGFVSLDAQNEEGSVVTAPLVLKGESLHVNAIARPGTVKVEVLDVDGEPVSGFAYEDCEPMSGDSLDHTITWKGDRKLAGLRDQPVRIRFALQGAKLYSFWIV